MEPEKSTHQDICEEMNIYANTPYSVGSVLLLPNGTKLWRALETYFREEYKKRGYSEVITPIMANSDLWKKSGHWENYKENMYSIKVTNNKDEEDDDQYCLKPMNCAFHCLMFNHGIKSYKHLPIRYADFGCLHRNETSGSLRGMNRLRKFCQDDAHIFCTIDQIFDEIVGCINFLQDTYKLFGFEYKMTLSTRPDKFMGDLDLWNNAEKNLVKALESQKLSFTINDKDGAFYGPKIDVMVTDSLNREIQCGTIQLDFQLPQRFELEYTNCNGSKSIPVIIHRAICGSIERMMAVLIEHFQGKFPLWLSFRQVAIVPIATKPEFLDYCNDLRNKIMSFTNIDSVEIFDSNNDTFNSRLREAEVCKYNYILIVGGEEMKSNKVTFRVMNHVRNDKKMLDVNENFYNEFREMYYMLPHLPEINKD